MSLINIRFNVQKPAGSMFAENLGPSRLDMQACFQFLGVNLSTMALNASYDPSTNGYLSSFLTYQSTKALISFEMFPW